VELVEYPQAEATDPKHEALLEASVAVFARYGFRKTSMDEVARAAGVSRQGLYLLFADKEELFRRAVTYQLNKQLGAAVLALANPSAPLEARLISAGDEWGGRFVGLMGGDAADLMCASTSMAGETLMHFQARFESALTQAIACSPLADSCALLGVTPSEVARTLHATIRGLKHSCKTRLEFVQGMTAAARMFCAPLASTARLGP
jgi:AcrR family transcriptional regulator